LKTSIHHSLLVIATCALVPLAACATTTPPAELVDARAAYATAADTATESAPTELHAALLALNSAEATFKDAPKSVEVKDRAYIAQRRAELASARAAIFMSHERRDAANVKLRSLGAAAVTELKETKENLDDAQQHARASDRDVRGLKTDLKASEQNLKESESSLRVSESNASGLTTQLATETQARHDAESKLTATLQAMHDLQSVKEEPRGLVITLSGAVLFASGQSVLLPAAQSALNNVAEALKATPNRAIRVEGHTDSQGTVQSNVDLSQRRGDAVRRYLVSRGIPEAGISASGMGQDHPVADNNTADGRANNRRVEIVLAPAPV
jgi:outer membrane protein OmpA-like peptidoglycan-associated protein